MVVIYHRNTPLPKVRKGLDRYKVKSLFGWLVPDGWCWFVLREKYCWLVTGGWFVVREKYCWLVADKPSEQGVSIIWDRDERGDDQIQHRDSKILDVKTKSRYLG
jgi:hypothetical protein